MASKIIGRTVEMSLMHNLLESPEAEFLAVYGRRRVGKTYLIREFYASHMVFALSGASLASLKTQLNHFFIEYTLRTKGKMRQVPPKNWLEAFQYLAEYLKPLNKKKVVVFLDELPWLDTPRSDFVGALEHFWNNYGSAMDHLLLVGCGSATSWMQKKIVQAKGGLHNRVTRRLHLQPFTLGETEAYCRNLKIKLTRYQLIQLYMVMGGVPFYLKALSPGKSVTQLIEELCFHPTGLLYDEYSILYKSLFHEHDQYLKVIRALAHKPEGLTRKEIEKMTHLAEGGTLTRTLEELELNGFIMSQKPFQRIKKEGIYKLVDLYTLFYLRFIEPNKPSGRGSWSALAQGRAWSTWSGYAYETVCMLHLPQIKHALGIGGVYTDISSWRYMDTEGGAQIDLIIDRQDGLINLCEIKFVQGEFIINKDTLQVLRHKRNLFVQVTKTRKSCLTTLVTTFPAKRNNYFLEEVQAEVSMDDLF